MENNTIPVTKQATSSVANTEAVKQSVPTISVKLPSRGHFYPANHPLSGGTIELYHVTAKHEDILSNSNLLKKGIVLDEFLKALIATPNVTLNDVLIGDKNALFVESRKNAYGEDYATKIKCPECGEESLIQIDLSNIKPKEFAFENYAKGENKFSFTLPNSKKPVIWSLLTHKDENDIDQELKALAKLGTNASAPEVTTRLKYTIKSIDGETDRAKIKNYVDNQMAAKDSLAFRKHVREVTPDLDMTFNFNCPKCGHQTKMSIPLGANFFWPNLSDRDV
jgi:rRNA maturation protein Nop10